MCIRDRRKHTSKCSEWSVDSVNFFGTAVTRGNADWDQEGERGEGAKKWKVEIGLCLLLFEAFLKTCDTRTWCGTLSIRGVCRIKCAFSFLIPNKNIYCWLRIWRTGPQTKYTRWHQMTVLNCTCQQYTMQTQSYKCIIEIHVYMVRIMLSDGFQHGWMLKKARYAQKLHLLWEHAMSTKTLYYHPQIPVNDFQMQCNESGIASM